MLLLIFIFRLRLSVIPVVLGRDHPLLGLGTQLLLQIAHLRLQGSCNRYQKGITNVSIIIMRVSLRTPASTSTANTSSVVDPELVGTGTLS